MKTLRLRPLLFTAVVLFICAGFIVYARTSRGSKGPYRLSEDLPRGALVYAQFENLPSLIKQWDESHLKQQYLESTNYRQLQHRHLPLKLVSRWEEFNEALDFPLDMATLSASTENEAAVAIYDIGRLDLVFIAPLSDEKAALTKFFQGKDGFEETEAPDGTAYYHHAVEADRGRQKQVIAFATLNGRFILATNETLLLRAIANINRRATKDSLAAEPAFKTLSQRLSPHFATVWVDQTKLNTDYYFKHYWLMQNLGRLKGIRAGMFDLELQEGKWIERREFLMAGKETEKSEVSAAEMRNLYSVVPSDAPFLRIRSLAADPALSATITRDTLFDRALQETTTASRSWSWQTYEANDFYFSDDGDNGSYNRYSYLDSSFDTTIDDPYDARMGTRAEPGANPLAKELEQQFLLDLQQAIVPARPTAVAVATSPRPVAGPLFVEFRKVAVINLQLPGNLRRDLLDAAIAKAAMSHLTVGDPTAAVKWETLNHSGFAWRELRIPMLGWEICYALRDRDLILANSAALLKATLESTATKNSLDLNSAGVDELTVIRLDQRKQAFDDVIDVLDAGSKKPKQGGDNQTTDSSEESQGFFSGNIRSLLNVGSAISRVEIKRNASANFLHEELTFVF